MKSIEIRTRFFNYFKKHGHEQVNSSSLIPAQDPTLLFANAGMNQFKDLFLGKEKRNYLRAVTIQKCVRAGGKHNDLDNVGFTKRHLTFFEMMGNFSFGDYFKKDAIVLAWQFLTKELGINDQYLHASIFESDDDAYAHWLNDVGLPAHKIHRLGHADNFWQMGDVGPCGPCTEIYIDRGIQPSCMSSTACNPACDCGRFLEIWNLVFMQYNKQPDGTLEPLKQTGVDTGMGLERLCVVMQNKDSVFNTDLFENLIAKIEELSGLEYANQPAQIQAAFHVLADHIRSAALLIADGCAPSNEGRGYVLRKIIRRASLFSTKLGSATIFPDLSSTVVTDLGNLYKELGTHASLIHAILSAEVEKFSTSLVKGQLFLEQYLKEADTTKQITGTQAFKLYDTYGFPLELVVAATKERQYTVDTAGFETAMAAQQSQSGKKVTDALTNLELPETVQSAFTGYTELETTSTVVGLIHNNSAVDTVPQGQECYVIAKSSPFFIVGGGQVPDQGWLTINSTKVPITSVRYINTAIAAQITTPVAIKVGDTVTSHVDPIWRTNAMKNHTATHLLQAALIELFGKQIQQSGSLVHPDYLRFDFTYHENLNQDQIEQVEALVNSKIRENIPVQAIQTTLKNALNQGALAFFGDKYKPENVRMIAIDSFSKELCGGTHVPTTGAIGVFKITEVSALSAGHRRIVAVTGPRAVELFQECFATTKIACQEFKVKREELLNALLKQKEQIKLLQSSIKLMRTQLWQSQVATWISQVERVGDIPTLTLSLQDYTIEELRPITQALLEKLPGFYFLLSCAENRFSCIATVHPIYKDRFDMQKFASWLHVSHGIKGGVSKNTLQGGGEKFDATSGNIVKEWIQSNIV